VPKPGEITCQCGVCKRCVHRQGQCDRRARRKAERLTLAATTTEELDALDRLAEEIWSRHRELETSGPLRSTMALVTEMGEEVSWTKRRARRG